ncbi:MAG: hypothetical protein WCX46_02390 [Candidatus Paceibacterota bacterium]
MSNLKFKIGADPEFNLEMENKKLDAAATIKTLLTSNKEFKISSKGDGYSYKNFGNIGWDGHNATAEIRPSAENTPKDLVKNMEEIFKKFHEIAPSFQMSTLSRYAPIGGHVHFELSNSLTKDQHTMKAKVQAIHKRMASFLLPLTLGENKVNQMVRMRSSSRYGEYCTPDISFRVDAQYKKTNGDPGYTYELRTQSAEWLTTPQIAKATLAYLATVYNEITNNPKQFNEKYGDIIIRTNEMGNALQSLALTEYKLITTVVFNKIKKYIKQFELYETYKEEIDYILNPNKVLADKQAADYDIRIGWGLQLQEKEAPKKTILSEKEFLKISKDKDIESLSKIYKIDYNNDLNVKTFTEVLSQKMAAFNWKLSKQFFFFGIRKGIESYIIMNGEKEVISGLEIAKTKSDQETIQKIMTNMYNTYTEEYQGQEKNKINFITGKIEKTTKDIFIIGIPYKDRVELNTKKFIETVYNVDKNIIKKAEKNNKELIDDTKETDANKGEIFKIINKLSKEEERKEIAIEANGDDEVKTNNTINQIEQEVSEDTEETELLEENNEDIIETGISAPQEILQPNQPVEITRATRINE